MTEKGTNMSASVVDATIKRAREAIQSRPDDATLHGMIADLFEKLGRFGEAVPHLKFLVSERGADDEMLCARYISALFRSGAVGEAERAVNAALERLPASCVLLHSKALVLLLLAEFEKSLDTYKAIRTLDSDDRYAAGMSGFIKLLLSDMREGFEDYAERPHNDMLPYYFDAVPEWDGEALSGKRVVLWSEQGIGDVVMFLGLLPWIGSQAREVAVVVTEKLAPLVRRSFPGVKVISEEGVSGIASMSFDVHVPLGDLVEKAIDSFEPAGQPEYLKADGTTVARLQAKYRGVAAGHGRRRLVGISWHTTNPDMGFTRNVGLDQLWPLFSIEEVQFVSLQYGDHSDAIAQINQRCPELLYVDDSVDAFGDLDTLAAQIKAMDEVITIDNSTVHLAGALGVPTTLLLPACPDWRWGLKRDDCRWYRSVKYERQATVLRWKQAIKNIRASLEAHG